MKGCGKLPFVLASLVLYCCSLRSQRWGSFLSNAICEAHAAKATMYSLRSYSLYARFARSWCKCISSRTSWRSVLTVESRKGACNQGGEWATFHCVARRHSLNTVVWLQKRAKAVFQRGEWATFHCVAR